MTKAAAEAGAEQQQQSEDASPPPNLDPPPRPPPRKRSPSKRVPAEDKVTAQSVVLREAPPKAPARAQKVKSFAMSIRDGTVKTK